MVNFLAQKFYEVIQYGSNLQTSPGNVIGITVSEKTWQKLSPSQQQALQEAADESGIMGREMELSEMKEMKQKLVELGVTFTEVDASGFQETLNKMPYTLEEKGIWSEGLYDAIKADLGM